MIDIANQLKAIHRAVDRKNTDGEELVAVVLRRRYDAAIDDVWHAVTDPERIARWLMPISGELRVGGTFQLEGNAGGEILACEPPRRLTVTFGGDTSLVHLTLTADGEDATDLELEHTVPVSMAGGVAGSLYVGPGWDGSLLALDLFLRGEADDDPVAAAKSLERQEFAAQSVHAWAAAAGSSPAANPDEITAATTAALAHFAPDTTP